MIICNHRSKHQNLWGNDPDGGRQFPPAVEEIEIRTMEIKKEKEKERVKWADTLPSSFPELQVEREDLQIVDNYGNFLFYIPNTPVENFQEWLEKEITDYINRGEK